MSSKPAVGSPDWLRREYVTRRRPVTEIATELDVDVATVHRRLRAVDIPPRGPGDRHDPHGALLTRERLGRILARKPRPTAREIARELHVDHASVLYWIRRHHLDHTAVPKGDVARLRGLYERRGLSIRAVAAELGVSPRTATERLLAAGITLRPRGRPKNAG